MGCDPGQIPPELNDPADGLATIEITAEMRQAFANHPMALLMIESSIDYYESGFKLGDGEVVIQERIPDKQHPDGSTFYGEPLRATMSAHAFARDHVVVEIRYDDGTLEAFGEIAEGGKTGSFQIVLGKSLPNWISW